MGKWPLNCSGIKDWGGFSPLGAVMDGTVKERKASRFLLVVVCAASLLTGCRTTPASVMEMPPVLAQEEILRPYQQVAVLEVQRKRYGSPEDLTPEDYTWVYDALRKEANRLGADAVIFPEVKVEVDNYYFFPTSIMRGKGTAIRFE